ncbi:MAG: germination protein YpeB [Eubacteriales bacterium]|nr:germination protein YpeB [Eubacteriales bacterium]
MGYIREKLLDLKRRLQDRKMYSIVIVIIAAVSIFGVYQYKNASQLRQELDNRYNNAFYEMSGYVDNVQLLLIKSLLSSTPQRTALTLQDAWRQSNMAQANLGQLPVSQHTLANTSKFLTQVGDLAFSLNTQTLAGKPITEEQYKTVENLYKYALQLDQSLQDLETQLSSGRIKWGELKERGTSIFTKTSANLPQQQFENLDKTFQEYPTLIYDGPFSDHMTSLKPKGLTGEDIDIEQGKNKVIEFFGKDKVASVENTGRNDNEPLKTFSYSVKFVNAPEDQVALIDITQKGGHIYWMLYNRPSGEKQLEIDQAKEAGRKFLEERGIKNMADTYYTNQDNIATINYAYKQDNVVVYPDLIKLKISLDNGEIIGMEAKGYLYSHSERKIPEPGLTLESAKAKLNPRIEIASSGLAIIPTEFKTEIFTYEFKGRLYDKDFLIYINAENGSEEKILMIINTPDGILTM